MKIYSDLGIISIFRAEFEKIVLPTLMDFRGRVLDLGCSSAIYRDVFQVGYIGTDLTKTEFPSNNDKHQFIVSNGNHLPFKDNCFDLVICNGVLEHTEYPRKIIAEISRVLKYGETVIISVPTPPGLRWESPPKFKGFTIDELENILNSFELNISQYKKGGGFFAQALHTIETSLASNNNIRNWEEKDKEWDPRLKTDHLNSIIGIRRFMIDLISSLEIKSGLNNIHPQGIYVWAKKGT